jgi:hypothetical protein
MDAAFFGNTDSRHRTWGQIRDQTLECRCVPGGKGIGRPITDKPSDNGQVGSAIPCPGFPVELIFPCGRVRKPDVFVTLPKEMVDDIMVTVFQKVLRFWNTHPG